MTKERFEIIRARADAHDLLYPSLRLTTERIELRVTALEPLFIAIETEPMGPRV